MFLSMVARGAQNRPEIRTSGWRRGGTARISPTPLHRQLGPSRLEWYQRERDLTTSTAVAAGQTAQDVMENCTAVVRARPVVVVLGVAERDETEAVAQAIQATDTSGLAVVRVVQRDDGVVKTILRKVATHARGEDVWVDGKTCVANGEAVTLLRRQSEFGWVRTGGGKEGYVKLSYLKAEDERAIDGWVPPAMMSEEERRLHIQSVARRQLPARNRPARDTREQRTSVTCCGGRRSSTARSHVYE